MVITQKSSIHTSATSLKYTNEQLLEFFKKNQSKVVKHADQTLNTDMLKDLLNSHKVDFSNTVITGAIDMSIKSHKFPIIPALVPKRGQKIFANGLFVV